jgi:hypothetical protein
MVRWIASACRPAAESSISTMNSAGGTQSVTILQLLLRVRNYLEVGTTMSFGYGVGDFLAVTQLALNVYKSCKEAPKHFQDISDEVGSLQDVLKGTEEFISAETVFLGPEKEERLRKILDGCYEVLTDLETLLEEFSSLGTKNKRAFDRLRWGQEEVVALRGRIISHIVLLNDFKTSLRL